MELTAHSRPYPAQTFAVYDGKKYPGLEVTILAPSRASAERAANLIHGATLLDEGCNFFSPLLPGENQSVYPNEEDRDLDVFLTQQFRCTDSIPFACLMAAKISMRRCFTYALAKLRLSFELFSAPGRALDPTCGDNIPKSHLPEEHVRLAYAIVLANACIEELGLRVPAHPGRQSWVNGNWNPEVKEQFEQTLRKANIDLNEPFLWTVRGGKTKLEEKRPPRITAAAPWNRRSVRDGDMHITDAIAYVGWLRSNVAAHTRNSMVKLLSIYDVSNAQSVARRLLMERLGFWRYWERGQRIDSRAR